MKKIFLFVLSLLLIAVWSCKKNGSDKGDYAELFAQGETFFESGDYVEALASFEDARDADPSKAEVYSAIGWCHIRLSNLTAASQAFSDGAGKSNPPVDLFAGWAFVLNAGKSYATSNTQINTALALDSAWAFTYGSSLNASDLHVLKASNHFLLGEFSQSLAEVKILDAAFNADVTTQTGLAQLSQKIEALKKQFEKKLL